jgi:hypothetical protein
MVLRIISVFLWLYAVARGEGIDMEDTGDAYFVNNLEIKLQL